MRWAHVTITDGKMIRNVIRNLSGKRGWPRQRVLYRDKI